jgi:hypothetical protein
LGMDPAIPGIVRCNRLIVRLHFLAPRIGILAPCGGTSVFVLRVAPEPGPSPRRPGAERSHGEYTLRLRDLVRFPTSWRCATGLLWVGFPPGVAGRRSNIPWRTSGTGRSGRNAAAARRTCRSIGTAPTPNSRWRRPRIISRSTL